MRCYRNAKDLRRKICRNAESYNILREGFRNIQKIKTGYPAYKTGGRSPPPPVLYAGKILLQDRLRHQT
jgi:hypothetical protein